MLQKGLMANRIYKSGALAALLILIAVIFGTDHVRTGAQAPDGQQTRVRRRTFQVTVNSVGVLDALRAHMISSTVHGDRGKIVFLIEDGRRVKKGDVLVRLDTTAFEEAVQRLSGEVTALEAAAEASRQMLEWEKSQVQREIRSARYDLKIARLERDKLASGEGAIQLAQYKSDFKKAAEAFARYGAYIAGLKKLRQAGFGNAAEIALAQKKRAALKEKYEAARQKYTSYRDYVLPAQVEAAGAKAENAALALEQVRTASVFKIAKSQSLLKEALGRLETARRSLKQARRELAKTTIRAPFDGLAILYETFRNGQKRKPRIGDRIWQNQPLLYLPDVSQMLVKTRVREIDLHKVSVGQPCSIRIDAFPDVSFSGRVKFVGALAARRTPDGSGEKYFQLTIALAGKDMRLRPGMTARVTVLTDTVKDALSLPLQAVFDTHEGQHFVYRLQGRKFERVRVATGRQNEDFVEILSGLREGDRVSLSGREDGARG